MNGFEWDAKKAAANEQKHEVSFADAVFVFKDEAATTVIDEASPDEERWATIGTDAIGKDSGRGLYLAQRADQADLSAAGDAT